MPSQADEEAHQLSYLQKHLGNILSLLADTVEGEGEESLVSNLATALFSLYLFVLLMFFVCYFLEVEINFDEAGETRKINTGV